MKILDEIKNKNYLKLLIVIAGIVFVLRFMLLPFFSAWTKLNTIIASKELQLNKALGLIARKDSIDKMYSQLNFKVDVEELFQPQELQKLSLYKEVNSLADKNGVRIKSMRPSSGLEEGVYFDVQGEGSFSSVIDFISRLENPYTQNYIQELVLTPSGGRKILFRLKIKREFL